MRFAPPHRALALLTGISLLAASTPASAQGTEEGAHGAGGEASAEATAASGGEAQPVGRLWTLDELLASAREHADALDVTEAGKRHAEWQAYRAKYAWAPKVRADSLLAPVPANTDPNQISENFDEILALNIGPFFRQTLRLVVPVYTFGRIKRAQDLAEVGVANADLEHRKAALDLAYQIKRAYYGLQLARSFDAMLRDGSKLVGEKLQEMEDARDFGEADFDIADLRKLQIFAAELDSRALDNQKLIRLGLAGVAYLSGEELALENIPKLDEETEPAPLASLEHYQRTAERQRPEVRQLARAVEARRHQLALQRAAFFPTIFFGANFTYGVSTEEIARQKVERLENGQWVETDLAARPFANAYDQSSFGVSLGLRWDFDFFQLQGKYRESEALVDKTSAQRAQALGAIRLEIEKLYVEAAQARERIAIEARRLEAARRWRDQLGLSMQSAGADVSDAIDPLKAYYSAKVLHMQAIMEYRVARAALAKGVGLDALEDAGLDAPAVEPGEGDAD